MGMLLFLVFMGLLVLGLWRGVNVSMNADRGRNIRFNTLRGSPFFILAALIFIFWMSFTTN